MSFLYQVLLRIKTKLMPVFIKSLLKQKHIGWLQVYYVTWKGIPVIDDSLRKRMLSDIKVAMIFINFRPLFLVDIKLLIVKNSQMDIHLYHELSCKPLSCPFCISRKTFKSFVIWKILKLEDLSGNSSLHLF